MSLHKAGTRHDGQRDLVEGFQQPLRGGLRSPSFGIARKESGDLLLLFSQRMPNHPFQKGDDAQSDGQEANETHTMIITLHVQRPQRQRMAFESSKIALDQV